MPDGERVEVSRLMPAPIDDVWSALTDPSSLGEWFGADVVEFEAEAGGRLVVRTEDCGVRRAYVDECRPPDRLVLRWLPIEELPDGSTIALPQTTVEISLTPDTGGTLVTIVETYGFVSTSPAPPPPVVERPSHRPPSMLLRV